MQFCWKSINSWWRSHWRLEAERLLCHFRWLQSSQKYADQLNRQPAAGTGGKSNLAGSSWLSHCHLNSATTTAWSSLKNSTIMWSRGVNRIGTGFLAWECQSVSPSVQSPASTGGWIALVGWTSACFVLEKLALRFRYGTVGQSLIRKGRCNIIPDENWRSCKSSEIVKTLQYCIKLNTP